MINGDAGEFIDELAYQDHYAIFRGKKIFINACQCEFDNNGKVTSAVLEVYNLTDSNVLFSTRQANCSKCVEKFENASIWAGETFWQAEQSIEWVDC